MRARITKIATTNRPTEITQPDRTMRIAVRPETSPTRRPWWIRLLIGLGLRQAVPVAVPSAPQAVEGELVEFRGWAADGSVDYHPFPATVDEAITYDKPVAILVGCNPDGRPLVWHTSPVQMIYGDPADRSDLPRPVRFETRSSLYAIEWLSETEKGG